MVTLATYGGGGVTFYPPYYSPDPTVSASKGWPTTTTAWPTRPPFWTTPPSTTGVSVCLRFIKDFRQESAIFQLDPGSYRSLLLTNLGQDYWMSQSRYGPKYLMTPNLQIWPNLYPEIWSRVCLVVDSMKNVAQLYSGSYMSARKLIPPQIGWSGRPMIDITEFDGQVTDIQVWDYAISSNMVYYYMIRSTAGGNALTWSNIGYSARGRILMEDSYQYMLQEEEAGQRGSRRRHKVKMMFVNVKGGRMKNQM
ncbi:jeltraxin-like [Synchiropus picturatus]